MQVDTEVIVVGAGPTGLMLAGELALAGIAVEVVERQEVASGQARGGGVSPRTAEVLEMRGLLDAVLARAVPGPGGHFAGLPVPLDNRPWRTRHPAGVAVAQDELETILEDHLVRHGGRVRRGTELTGFDLDGGSGDSGDGPGPVVTVRDSSGEHRLGCRYLVACDGGHSTVRALAGVEFPGHAATRHAVSADVVLAARSATVPRDAAHISTLTATGGGYWLMMHPIEAPGPGPVRYRVVFGGAEQATLPRSAPVTPEEVERALVAVHGPDTRLGTLRWGTRFSDASRQVTDYRVGRVLFAGDAAHIHLPLGGQGLNLGVQDAVNLGWKLAAHLRGRVDAAQPNALLDSYHAERHPVAARVIATIRAANVLMNPPPDRDDVLELRRIVGDLARLPDANRYLAGMISGLDIRYDLGGSDPLVGARMPDLDLRTTDGTRTRVATLLRTGRGLLLDLAAGDPTTDAPAAGVPAGAEPTGTEATGTRPRGRGPAEDDKAAPTQVTARPIGPAAGDDAEIGTATGAAPDIDRILVRPDGVVCWVGTGPDADPGPALRRWFGSAAPEPGH